MKKNLPSIEHVETLSLVAMRRLVGGLVEELHSLKARSQHCGRRMRRCEKTMPSYVWRRVLSERCGGLDSDEPVAWFFQRFC